MQLEGKIYDKSMRNDMHPYSVYILPMKVGFIIIIIIFIDQLYFYFTTTHFYALNYLFVIGSSIFHPS